MRGLPVWRAGELAQVSLLWRWVLILYYYYLLSG